MQEKPFEEITVQHVLDRAGVGRSTFYAHYRGKDDLILSDADEFFEHMAGLLSKNREASNRVAPVRELFTHVAQAQKFGAALISAGKLHDTLELAQGHFARGIERRLSEIPRSRGLKADRRAAMAHALAGSMISLMMWWMHHGTPASAEQMDELFHRMVWTGVGS
jgi:AcrR family transcriptional regulator